MNDNISLDTFKQIVKAGVLMGKANPNKSTDELVKVIMKEFINQLSEVS